mmetsp:Transcript_33884/g.85874  ORF Transcript_33884/g.85874 Transcript_33884/m.85874 type:complete len:219 (-) Transcript_33884:258-914(-)
MPPDLDTRLQFVGADVPGGVGVRPDQTLQALVHPVLGLPGLHGGLGEFLEHAVLGHARLVALLVAPAQILLQLANLSLRDHLFALAISVLVRPNDGVGARRAGNGAVDIPIVDYNTVSGHGVGPISHCFSRTTLLHELDLLPTTPKPQTHLGFVETSQVDAVPLCLLGAVQNGLPAHIDVLDAGVKIMDRLIVRRLHLLQPLVEQRRHIGDRFRVLPS